MGDIWVTVPTSRKRIKITAGDSLMGHAQVLQLRLQAHDLIDQQLRPARQRVEEVKLKLREAEVADEQGKLALDVIRLEGRKAHQFRLLDVGIAHGEIEGCFRGHRRRDRANTWPAYPGCPVPS